jgi:hypothetical protein
MNKLFEENLIDLVLKRAGYNSVKGYVSTCAAISVEQAYEMVRIEVGQMIAKEYLKLFPMETFEEFKLRSL